VTDERRANYQTQHLAIVDALHERDAALAADLIRDHLLEVRGALLGF
jgi:DNA-binding GntR family transcriptional regulator